MSDGDCLILFRHAKSDRSCPGQSDFERGLSPRGRRDATKMGRWFTRQDIRPDCVLSSPSRRTRETLRHFRLGSSSGSLPPPIWEQKLYHASAAAMLALLSEARCGRKVMLVGHNPGLEELLFKLVGAVALPHAYQKPFPTGAIYVLALDGRLSEIRMRSARVLLAQRPRALDRTGIEKSRGCEASENCRRTRT